MRPGIFRRPTLSTPTATGVSVGATLATHVRASTLYDGVLKRHKRAWHQWNVNPKIRGLIQTLDGKGDFLFNTRIKSIDEPPDPNTIARAFLACVGEEVPISFTDRVRGTSKMSSRIVAEAMTLVTVWGIRDRVLRRGRRRRSG